MERKPATKRPVDPGYGGPRAADGTEQWAKRWRLSFQCIALELPEPFERARRYYELGLDHRAWSLITDADGRIFADFDAFCVCAQPYGLGMEPTRFRGFLALAKNEFAADQMAAPLARVLRLLEELDGDQLAEVGRAVAERRGQR